MKKRKPAGKELIDQRPFINNVSWTYLCAKRSFDLAISILAIVLLSPVFPVTAVWIKIRSRGAVFRTEEKYGLKGNKFKTCEFAKIIKNVYIIKLPLLFNVFTGKMSLVGPQPLPAGNMAKDAWYNLRMSAKPGITGLWQIGRKVGGVNEMVRVDLKYIRERSFRRDLKIILKAICLVFGKKRPSK